MDKTAIRSRSCPDPRSPVLFWPQGSQLSDQTIQLPESSAMVSTAALLSYQHAMTLHLFSEFCSTHTQLSFREKPYRLILVIIRLEVTFPDGVTIFMHKQNNMEVEK